jgi:hypothetical protein
MKLVLRADGCNAGPKAQWKFHQPKQIAEYGGNGGVLGNREMLGLYWHPEGGRANFNGVKVVLWPDWSNGKRIHLLSLPTGTPPGPANMPMPIKCRKYFYSRWGCEWTRMYSCPGQPEYKDQFGRSLKKGTAKKDKSMAYECCCTKGLWNFGYKAWAMPTLKITEEIPAEELVEAKDGDDDELVHYDEQRTVQKTGLDSEDVDPDMWWKAPLLLDSNPKMPMHTVTAKPAIELLSRTTFDVPPELVMTEDQKKAYNRDHEAIKSYQQIMVALQASMGSKDTMQFGCWELHNFLDLECWIREFHSLVQHITKLYKQVEAETKKVINLVHELGQIKPIAEKLAVCLMTLPGAMPLDKALIGLAGSLESNDLFPYLGRTYINPLVTRVEENWNGAVSILQEEVQSTWQCFKDGKVNEEAVKALPQKFIALSIRLLEVDPTGKCMVQSEITQELVKLADVPIFNHLFRETLNGLLELWRHMKPMIDQTIEWFSNTAKAMVRDWIQPLLAPIDQVVADAINYLCVKGTNEVYGWVKGAAKEITKVISREQMCALKFDKFITDPKVTMKAVISAVLTWTSREITKLLDQWVYQPMLQALVNVVTWANGGIMQVLDGLCGLIPFVGGVICAAITTPLSWLTNEAVAQLTSGTVKGLMGAVQGWLDGEIPKWSDSIASMLVNLVDQGVSYVDAQIPQEAKEVANVATGIAHVVTPIMQAVQPFFMDLAKLAFPKMSDRVDQCKASLDLLENLVKCTLCIDKAQDALSAQCDTNPNSLVKPEIKKELEKLSGKEEPLPAIAHTPLDAESSTLMETGVTSIECSAVCTNATDATCTRCHEATEKCHSQCEKCDSPDSFQNPEMGCDTCQKCLAQLMDTKDDKTGLKAVYEKGYNESKASMKYNESKAVLRATEAEEELNGEYKAIKKEAADAEDEARESIDDRIETDIDKVATAYQQRDEPPEVNSKEDVVQQPLLVVTATPPADHSEEDAEPMTDEHKTMLYNRDRQAIETYKSMLIALHAAMGSNAQIEIKCEWWDFDCWKNAAEKLIEQVKWLWDQVVDKANQITDLVKQLGQIKPVLEHLGACIMTLPGMMPLDQAFIGLSDAAGKNNLFPYLGETYISPVVLRVEKNWNGAVEIIQKELKETWDLFKDGQINAEAIAKLPKKMMHMSIKLLAVDPTGRCLVESPIMKGLEELADVPIFNQLFKETVQGLVALWNAMKPLIHQTIQWFGDQIKSLIQQWITPLLEPLDKVVADVINVVCVHATDTVHGWVKGIKKADVCQFSFDKLLSDPKVTTKLIISAALTWVSREITKLLDQWVYQPLLQQLLNLITWANGGIMQVLDGLCGLIPEVGGLICAAITTPLSWVVSEASTQLTSTAVRGLMGAVQGWLDGEIPKWSDSIAGMLADLVNQGASWAGAQIPAEAKSFAQNEASGLAKAMAPVLEVVKPIFMDLAQLFFPKMTTKMKECTDGLDSLSVLVKDRMCVDGQVSDKGVYSATPTRRLLGMHSPLSLPLIATRAKNIHCSAVCDHSDVGGSATCLYCREAFDNCHTPCSKCEGPDFSDTDPEMGCKGCRRCIAQTMQTKAAVAQNTELALS